MRLKYKNYRFLLILLILLISAPGLHPQQKKPDDATLKKNNTTEKAAPKKYKLSVATVLDYLLKNNHDVKKTLLEYKGTNSGLLMYQAKYDVYFTGAAGYTVLNSYNSMATPKPMQIEAMNYYTGLQKHFSTGTSVSAGLTGVKTITPASRIMGYPLPEMDLYQTGVKVELTQDLLKNSFGMNDRLAEEAIANSVKMQKEFLKLRLSGLVIDAVVGYWNVVIAEELLQASEINLKSTIDIKNLIGQKIVLGLSEQEDILDWNGKVLQSRNNNERAKKLLSDSKMTVARVLDLEQDSEFEFITRFKTEAPDVNYEQALKDAFIKRVDWNNQKIIARNAEIEYKLAYNNQLPALQLKAAAGNQGYDASQYYNTLGDYNKEYSVGMQLMYPLGDSAGDARMRDARLGYMKVQVATSALEKQIRDEVKMIVGQCDVNFKIYQQTKGAREYAQNYYYQVLQKYKRGRYSALQLKLALDGYTQSRYAELQSLIEYNISLLRRDFARNMIFENLGVDVDGILKQME